MKKFIVFTAVAAAMTFFAGCSTFDLTTNKVGWSNYAEISVKDYMVLGIITLESQEAFEYGPFGFNKSYKGSRIVWSDLMAEAARLGANDVINVRIEETNYNHRIPRFFEFFTGYSTTWRYKATALAIKYTDAVERQKSVRQDNLSGQNN